MNSSFNLIKCFQKVLGGVIKDVDPKFYLDDILIYARTEEEMLWKLKIFIETLRQKGFTLNGLKCQFCFKTVKWAGFNISQNCIAIPHNYLKKLDGLTETQPSTTKQASRIFGVLSYVRAFSAKFATLTSPIVEAITNGNKSGYFKWGEKEQAALLETVDELRRSCRLYKVRYGQGHDLFVFSDASKYTISAVMGSFIDLLKKFISHLV